MEIFKDTNSLLRNLTTEEVADAIRCFKYVSRYTALYDKEPPNGNIPVFRNKTMYYIKLHADKSCEVVHKIENCEKSSFVRLHMGNSLGSAPDGAFEHLNLESL